MCGEGPPRLNRITMSSALACLEHHCAMQTTPAKRGAPEGTDFSGAIRVNEFGNYAKAHIKMRCVDKGDNARMLAWCDIGATPESIGMSVVRQRHRSRQKESEPKRSPGRLERPRLRLGNRMLASEASPI